MELLKLIASSNILEIEEYLIKNPNAINKTIVFEYKHQTPLLYAAQYCSIKIMKLLLMSCVDYGDDTNKVVINRLLPLHCSIFWNL